MVEMVVCALADSMASSDSYSPSLRFSRFRSLTITEHKVYTWPNPGRRHGAT